MAPNKKNTVECPECGEKFDIADRLRAHIETEVHSELSETIRSEMEEKFEKQLASQSEEDEEQRQALDEKVREQRSELKDLRKTKIKLEDLEETTKIEIDEATAKAIRETKRNLNQELEETISERVKEENAKKELENEKLQEQLNRQNKKIKELETQRTTSHGELEGEVLELAVEETLNQLFPRDSISEVKKGKYGADVHQNVFSDTGISAGKIIWECKKHKNWSKSWVTKLRQDAIDASADTMVIVSTTLPDGMASFGKVDDVFVCMYHEVPIVAELLRYAVLRVSQEKNREENMMTIQERVREYVSGPEFSMVMQGVMKAYEAFEDDIRTEEQYMKRKWKSRRGYLRNVIDSMTSMIGKLEHLGGGEFDVMKEISFEQPPIDLLPTPRDDEEDDETD